MKPEDGYKISAIANGVAAVLCAGGGILVYLLPHAEWMVWTSIPSFLAAGVATWIALSHGSKYSNMKRLGQSPNKAA